jgi:flavin reductase (DIM6/NTAB) family NADH-FMN oxidoreductase RutF
MDAATRKTVLRMIPYGLYVLTVDGEQVAAGTINWLSQMSFEPPLLALGVKRDTRSFANLGGGGTAALSFLGAGQGELAFAFFGDAPVEGDAFVTKNRRVPFERSAGGGIVLSEAPAWADLRVRETIAIGDHAVVVAEVIDVGQRADQPEILTLRELGLNYGG